MRLDAHDARSVALRSIRRNTNDAKAFCFCFVNQGCWFVWTSCGEDDSIDTAFHQFLERFYIPFSQSLPGTVFKLDAELLQMPRFVQDSAPKLVVEKMDFLGDAHADTHA